MARARGANAVMAGAFETTYGTAPVGGFKKLPFVSAALGDEQFGLIVSNPPYIAAADPHLEQGDVRFEPRSALAAGPQGLDDLAEIVAGAPARLIDGGWLFLEHGYDQAVAARSLLADAGFAAIASWKDLAGIERVSGGRWLGRRG